MNRLATIAFMTAVFTSGALRALPAAERDFPPVRELASSAALPDPLLMFDGRRVRTAGEWRERRRPELKALFEFYMYGAAPPAPDNVGNEDIHPFARALRYDQIGCRKATKSPA